VNAKPPRLHKTYLQFDPADYDWTPAEPIEEAVCNRDELLALLEER
jgi:hypothetical protein